MSAKEKYGVDRAGLAAVGMIVSVTMERVARLSPLERGRVVKLAAEYGSAASSEARTAAVLELDRMLRAIERREKAVSIMGARLREKRLAAGMSQEALATRSQIPQAHISRIETGRHKPGWMTLVRLAAGLGMSITELHPLGENANAETRKHGNAETREEEGEVEDEDDDEVDDEDEDAET